MIQLEDTNELEYEHEVRYLKGGGLCRKLEQEL